MRPVKGVRSVCWDGSSRSSRVAVDSDQILHTSKNSMVMLTVIGIDQVIFYRRIVAFVGVG